LSVALHARNQLTQTSFRISLSNSQH
jgi:hypothetical protein